jgi:hypothetical protein
VDDERRARRPGFYLPNITPMNAATIVASVVIWIRQREVTRASQDGCRVLAASAV